MRFLLTFSFVCLAQLNNLAIAATTTIDKTIPSLAKEPIGVASYVQMFLGLFVIVGLIVGMAWLMRRMSNVSGLNAGHLKVLAGVSVGQRERVVLIQAGDTQLLVGVAPGAVRTIHVMDEPIITQTSSTSTSSSGFAEKFHAAIKNRGNA